MTQSVIIGLEDGNALYMVDLAAGTVKPIDAAGFDRVGTTERPLVNGVSIAVAVREAPGLSAGFGEAH